MSRSSLFNWLGSKRCCASEIVQLIKHGINFGQTSELFVEPFAGSASVTLELAPKCFILNDINPNIINVFASVKNCNLGFHKHNNVHKEILKIRREFNLLKVTKKRGEY